MRNSGDRAGTATRQERDAPSTEVQPKPDLSDQGTEELLPKIFAYFDNDKEAVARALGVHRSSVDRWVSGRSRPNNSTLLRMRRLAQERGIE